jgi:flagellar hook-basal body complex protein FliE
MSIESIGAITGDVARSNAITPAQTNGIDFAHMVGDGLAGVDHSLQTADSQIRELAAGKDIPIHDVTIAMERARMDLMLVVEVRNRAIEGYQELMRMQL